MAKLWAAALLAALGLSFNAMPAVAGSASGGGGLAAAALVARHAPGMSAANRWRLAQYLAGHHPGPAAPAMITVTADDVHCRASNVDITMHACDLQFGAHHVTFNGRRAHELYATLLEIGVSPEGAAGTMHAEIHGLSCQIKPAEFTGGGGGDCTFTP